MSHHDKQAEPAPADAQKTPAARSDVSTERPAGEDLRRRVQAQRRHVEAQTGHDPLSAGLDD
ncbi:hypothetical protein [Phenylobacterium sp.]|uniref:hypothetical protein n=1 Tax=Phenylobacterium sp. TaxID=1871053 RepID=UPI002FD8B21D